MGRGRYSHRHRREQLARMVDDRPEPRRLHCPFCGVWVIEVEPHGPFLGMMRDRLTGRLWGSDDTEINAAEFPCPRCGATLWWDWDEPDVIRGRPRRPAPEAE